MFVAGSGEASQGLALLLGGEGKESRRGPFIECLRQRASPSKRSPSKAARAPAEVQSRRALAETLRQADEATFRRLQLDIGWLQVL